MSSLSHCVGDTIARSTAVAMKPHGGGSPGLIQPSQLARYGSKRIRERQGPSNLPDDAVWIDAESIEDPANRGNNREFSDPNARGFADALAGSSVLRPG